MRGFPQTRIRACSGASPERHLAGNSRAASSPPGSGREVATRSGLGRWRRGRRAPCHIRTAASVLLRRLRPWAPLMAGAGARGRGARRGACRCGWPRLPREASSLVSAQGGKVLGESLAERARRTTQERRVHAKGRLSRDSGRMLPTVLSITLSPVVAPGDRPRSCTQTRPTYFSTDQRQQS